MTDAGCNVTLPSKSPIPIHDNGKVLDFDGVFFDFSKEFRLDCLAKYITHPFRDTHRFRLYTGVTSMMYDVIPLLYSNLRARLENLGSLA